MKIIAVMNEKGGIGKTMTASSIAWILGEEEEKECPDRGRGSAGEHLTAVRKV